jgi:hypothetical protein
MEGWLYDDAPNGLYHFILLTLILGGAGAIASGRAIAGSWKSFVILPVYMVVMAAAVRFLHYALFQEELLSVPGFVVALVVTLLGAAFGYRARRAEQMATQYSWIYTRSGPLGWKSRTS